MRVCPDCGSHTPEAICPFDGRQTCLPGEEDAPDDPLIGTVFEERYRIDSRIGAGGMGAVYRARQLRVERDVAIKVLRSDLIRSRKATTRFEREARVASLMRHPNSVVTYDFGAAPAGLYLVMELLEGATLKEHLARIGTLRPIAAARIAAGIAASLAEAHSHGVVHRDLKPGNVVLHRVHELLVPKVLDFGIAKLVDDSARGEPKKKHVFDTSSVHGPAGTVVGTAAYMAPEYIIGKDLDGRADLYALGVLLHEMLLGRPPFWADDPQEILRMHVHAPLPRLPESVPEDLRILTTVMLAKSPARRPRTADEVLDALLRFGGDARTAGGGTALEPSLLTPFRSSGDSDEGAAAGELDEGAFEIELTPLPGPLPSPPREVSTPRIPPPPRRRPEPAPASSARTSQRTQAASGARLRLMIGVGAGAILALVLGLWLWPNGTSGGSDAPPKGAATAPSAHVADAEGLGLATNPKGWRTISAGLARIGASDDDTARHPSEAPLHTVQLTRKFHLKTTEVTRAEWRQVMGTTPSVAPGCSDRCPVENINWWDAVMFCNRLSEAEQREPCYLLGDCDRGADGGLTCAEVRFRGLGCAGYRLPTEAEWEHAAKAIRRTAYNLGGGGAEEERSRALRAVGSSRPNTWGLHDTAGNVSEWVWDWFGSDYYARSPRADPLGPEGGRQRVQRGCSWGHPAHMCRPSSRFAAKPTERSPYVGLRPAISAEAR